jgi:YD repeat-containing protein
MIISGQTVIFPRHNLCRMIVAPDRQFPLGFTMFLLILTIMVTSCKNQQPPSFSRYITDDPDFNFPSTIKSASLYDISDTSEVLILRITVESGNKLRHEKLSEKEETYDIDYYNSEGLLLEKRSYRGGKLRLINVYKATAIGVPVLDYQINEDGSKEQTWKAEVNKQGLSIKRVQVEGIPFTSPKDMVYLYNDKKQLTRIDHIFKNRAGFVQTYFYDSLGNLIRKEDKREDEQESLIRKEDYEFDKKGNWVINRTSIDWAGKTSRSVTKRKIEYFTKSP